MHEVTINGVRYVPAAPAITFEPGNDPGAVIRTARCTQRMTADQLAERSGVSTAVIYSLERGAHMPRFDKVAAMAQALGLSLDTLVGAKRGGA